MCYRPSAHPQIYLYSIHIHCSNILLVAALLTSRGPELMMACRKGRICNERKNRIVQNDRRSGEPVRRQKGNSGRSYESNDRIRRYLALLLYAAWLKGLEAETGRMREVQTTLCRHSRPLAGGLVTWWLWLLSLPGPALRGEGKLETFHGNKWLRNC